MGFDRIVKGIGKRQTQRGVLDTFFVGVFVVGELGKIVDLHAMLFLS
jgi:hypothetical protein